MTKKSKLLILLIAVILLLTLYLILSSESFKKEKLIPNENKTTAQLENNYISKTKELFGAYENMVKSDNMTLESIAALKNKLLDLKVPAKFKELHINFVLALAKMENYVNLKNEQEKIASQQMIGQLKADYSWLN